MSGRGGFGRFARRAALALLALALVLGVAAAVSIGLGVGRRERALERIRARGEPVLPSEIAFPPRGQGEDPGELLARLELLFDAVEEVEPSSIAECAREVEESEELYDLWERLDSSAWSDLRGEALSACERAYLARKAELQAEATEVVLRLGGCARHDGSARARLDPLSDAALSALPTGAAIRSTGLALEAAVLAADAGDARAAVELLEVAFGAADLFGGSANLLGQLVWALCQGRFAAGSVRVAAILPRGTDLSRVEALLAGIEPMDELRLAFLGERAFGNAIYASVRSGGGDLGDLGDTPGPTGILWSAFLAHDQADYLEEIERAIETASLPWDEVADQDWEPRIYGLVSALIVPRWWSSIEGSRRLAAGTLLARGALIARRAGAGAALDWVAGQQDPFGEDALRARVDEEGTLWIWSVGPDGVDDGGALGPEPPAHPIPGAPLDLVARARVEGD